MADRNEIAAGLEGVQVSMDKLYEILAVRVDEVEVKATRQRTWLLWAVLGLMVFVLLMVGWNRVTLQQAQDSAQTQTAAYLRDVINTCTVGAARLTPDKVRYCDKAIPGFSKARSATAQRALVIDSLERYVRGLGWVPPTTTLPPVEE